MWMNILCYIKKDSKCGGAWFSLGSSCIVLSELLEPVKVIEELTVGEKGVEHLEQIV